MLLAFCWLGLLSEAGIPPGGGLTFFCFAKRK
jgi:hypothetical protein